MTDQEILEQYKETIEKGIKDLDACFNLTNFNLTNDSEKQRAAAAYKRGFIKGFNEKNIEIARIMLQKNMSMETISDITGLSSQQIEEIQ